MRVVEVSPNMVALNKTPHPIDLHHVVFRPESDGCPYANDEIADDDRRRNKKSQREKRPKRQPSAALSEVWRHRG